MTRSENVVAFKAPRRSSDSDQAVAWSALWELEALLQPHCISIARGMHKLSDEQFRLLHQSIYDDFHTVVPVKPWTAALMSIANDEHGRRHFDAEGGAA